MVKRVVAIPPKDTTYVSQAEEKLKADTYVDENNNAAKVLNRRVKGWSNNRLTAP